MKTVKLKFYTPEEKMPETPKPFGQVERQLVYSANKIQIARFTSTGKWIINQRTINPVMWAKWPRDKLI